MVKYAYDVDRIRVQKVVDGTEVTNYMVDADRLYAQELEERGGNNNYHHNSFHRITCFCRNTPYNNK